jgi:proteasome lid subunit RPN8/RPN11
MATDLVLLIEDSQRKTMLDCIEMQYYRELVQRHELSRHLLRDNNEHIRYAQSCRDLTSSIPEDLVSLHSSIAAKALREVPNNPEGSIAIWRASSDSSVTVFRRAPAPTLEARCGLWCLRSDTDLVAHVSSLRAERLPNETGGVLVGAFDLDRKTIYIADVISSPADSKEWPVLYIRGCEGLADRLASIDQATGGMLQYVGEWHTHPDGCSTNPSDDDRKVFKWLTEHMTMEGLPPVMAIVGQGGGIRWFAGSLD